MIARFWPKVAKREPDECWEWTACKVRGGYGMIMNPSLGRGVLAHRVSWEIHNGPIPDGMFVCHRCDNPSCVNPSHLFLGSRQDNIDDMVAKGRQHRPNPDSCYRAKLTWGMASAIRCLSVSGSWSKAELSRMFGITDTMAGRIVNRKSWKHT